MGSRSKEKILRRVCGGSSTIVWDTPEKEAFMSVRGMHAINRGGSAPIVVDRRNHVCKNSSQSARQARIVSMV